MSGLKLKFDSTLAYQSDAVASVVELFAGLPVADATFSLSSHSTTQLGFTELGVANPVPADQDVFDGEMLKNLQVVQERNGVTQSAALAGRHFSVEMETGTGKTYYGERQI